MGICELASELFRSVPRSVKAVGIALAGTLLSAALTYATPNTSYAQSNGQQRTGQQEDTGSRIIRALSLEMYGDILSL